MFNGHRLGFPRIPHFGLWTNIVSIRQYSNNFETILYYSFQKYSDIFVSRIFVFANIRIANIRIVTIQFANIRIANIRIRKKLFWNRSLWSSLVIGSTIKRPTDSERQDHWFRRRHFYIKLCFSTITYTVKNILILSIKLRIWAV